MKVFVCLLALAALIQVGYAAVQLQPSNLSRETLDWSKIQRRDVNFPMPFLPEELKPDTRVVGGGEATPNAYPYLVALFIDTPAGTFFCGGSLISTQYVLTVAHCVDDAISVLVILGAHNIQLNEPGQVWRTATQFSVHQGWNPTNLVNDIATVRLEQPVSLTATIQLAILPTYGMVGNAFTGADVRIKGWGLTSDAGTSISDVVHVVYTNVIANFICNLAYLGAIQGTHICTSGGDGVGACSGDSGGPLTLASPQVQVGIVSFGIALGCEVGWPSVFTRTTSFLDWISANSDVTINP